MSESVKMSGCFSSCLKAGVLLVGLLSLVSCASLFKPRLEQDLKSIKSGEYVLDKDHASIVFKVDHMGFSKFIGRFNSFDASLDFDPDNIENSSLEAIIDMGSVDVNNEKFERALRGRFWFDAENYPQAFFKTRGAKSLSDKTLEFYGDLTFLGVTESIKVLVHFNGAANNILTSKYTLGFEAEASFQRSTFGLDRYIPTVGDNIALEIHAEFQRQ